MLLSSTQAIDACAERNGGCSAHAVCKRTLPGRRICMCHPGYEGDGKVCTCKCECLLLQLVCIGGVHS